MLCRSHLVDPLFGEPTIRIGAIGRLAGDGGLDPGQRAQRCNRPVRTKRHRHTVIEEGPKRACTATCSAARAAPRICSFNWSRG